VASVAVTASARERVGVSALTGTGRRRLVTARRPVRPFRTGVFTILLIGLAVRVGSAAAPMIDALNAQPAAVLPGGTVTVTVEAHDPDCASVCTTGCGLYLRSDLTSWSATGGTIGTIDNGTSQSPYTATAEWTAPAAEGTYTIEVSVSDSGGMLCGGRGTTTAAVDVFVSTTPNQPPLIDSLTAAPMQVFPGDVSTLQCIASDPDGDPLTIGWSADLGTVVPIDASTAELSHSGPGIITVTCVATDDRGASSRGDIRVSVTDVQADVSLTGPFSAPQRLAVDSMAQMYVADRRSGGITVAHLGTGSMVYRIPMPDVTTVAVDWRDVLLVGHGTAVELMDRSGATIGVLDPGMALGPVTDVAVDGILHRYAALFGRSGRVVVFGDDGGVLGAFGAVGNQPHQLKSPAGVAFLPDGRVVVGDAGHGLIKIFQIDGTLDASFGGLGGGVGEFVQLAAVAVDSRGVIFASDAYQDWIQSFDADGRLREVVGTYGDAPGQFLTAAGLAIAEPFNRFLAASLNGGSVQVFRLGGPDPPPLPAPEASLAPTSAVFPPAAVGDTGSTVSFAVVNAGTAPLGIIDVRAFGDFEVDSDCGAFLDPGETCTVGVRFMPRAPGQRTGLLSVQTSGSSIALTAALDGSAVVPPGLILQPDSLSFAVQAVGSVSPPQVVDLVNPGTVDLHVSAIDVGQDFGVVHGCSTVTGGQSCPVEVFFAPEAAGDPVTGQLTVTSDAADGPHQASLVGRSTIVGLTAAPGALMFSAVPVGQSSPSQRLVLTSSGTAGADIQRVEVIGPDPADFDIVTDGCTGSWLSPGASCTIDVTFVPLQLAERSAELLVRTADPLEFVVGMSGGRITIFRNGFEDTDVPWTGAVPVAAVTVTPKLLAFGPHDRLLRATVANPSSHPTVVAGVQVSHGIAGAFRIVDDACSGRRLEPGASCAVTIAVDDAAEGSIRASLVVSVVDRLGRGASEVPLSRSDGWTRGWR